LAEYPDWVLRHKRKGTYINYQNGKYYLYAAHSERIPGTGKVRRISDGYIGSITEKGGLIPAKGKLNASVHVYEYGLSETVFSLCAGIRKGLVREFRGASDFVFVGGALLFMFGEVMQEHYESSWLSVRLPGYDMRKIPTDKQRVGMERAQRMITDTLRRRFGEAYETAVALLPLMKTVQMGSETVVAEAPAGVKEFLRKNSLDLMEVHNG